MFRESNEKKKKVQIANRSVKETHVSFSMFENIWSESKERKEDEV